MDRANLGGVSQYLIRRAAGRCIDLLRLVRADGGITGEYNGIVLRGYSSLRAGVYHANRHRARHADAGSAHARNRLCGNPVANAIHLSAATKARREQLDERRIGLFRGHHQRRVGLPADVVNLQPGLRIGERGELIRKKRTKCGGIEGSRLQDALFPCQLRHGLLHDHLANGLHVLRVRLHAQIGIERGLVFGRKRLALSKVAGQVDHALLVRLLSAIGVDFRDQFLDERRAEVAIERSVRRGFLLIVRTQRVAHVSFHSISMVAGEGRTGVVAFPSGEDEVVHALTQRHLVPFRPEGAVDQLVYVLGDAHALLLRPIALFEQFVELVGGTALIVARANPIDDIAHSAIGGQELHEILKGPFQRLRVFFFVDLRRYGQRAARDAPRAQIGDVFMGDSVDGHGHAEAIEAIGGAGVGGDHRVRIVAGEDGDISKGKHAVSVENLGAGKVALDVDRHGRGNLDGAFRGLRALARGGSGGDVLRIDIFRIDITSQLTAAGERFVGLLIGLILDVRIDGGAGRSGLAAEHAVAFLCGTGRRSGAARRSGTRGQSAASRSFDGFIQAADAVRVHEHIAAGFETAQHVRGGAVVKDAHRQRRARAHAGARRRGVRGQCALNAAVRGNGDVAKRLRHFAALAQIGFDHHTGDVRGSHGRSGDAAGRARRRAQFLRTGESGRNAKAIELLLIVKIHVVFNHGGNVHANDAHGNARANANAVRAIGGHIDKRYIYGA